MHEYFGLSGVDLAVYQARLARPGVADTEVCDEAGVSEDQVRVSTEVLLERGLCRPAAYATDTVRAVSPDVGLRAILAEAETEVERQHDRLSRMRDFVARVTDAHAARREELAPDAVELLRGREATQTRLDEVLSGVGQVVEAFISHRPSTESIARAESPDRELLARGVTVRTLYLDSIRNDRANVDYLRRLLEQGAGVRTVPTLPARMILADRCRAFVALNPDDPGDGATLVANPGLVAALCALFDATWQRGHPVEGEHRCADGTGITASERELLCLLAAGSTEEGVARSLQVSARTVRRVLVELSERAGARSRFELAARAEHLGWLQDP